MKKDMRFRTRQSLLVRGQFKNYYMERIFNFWLNKYEVEGLSRDEREFILRELWRAGAVAVFDLTHSSELFLGSKPEFWSENVQLGFAPFAVNSFNMYNRPIAVTLVNLRGTPYVPTEKPLIVGKDAVLIQATHTRDPISVILSPLVDRLVDAEMVIRANLKSLKVTQMIPVGEDSELSAGDLAAQLEDDDPLIFVNSGMVNSIASIPGSSTYNVDKLYAYKKDVENEILTFLGINNTPFEKRERLLTDEVNSNNELIETSSSVLDDCLEESCKIVEEVFGIRIAFKPKMTASEMGVDKENDKETGGLDNDKETRDNDNGK